MIAPIKVLIIEDSKTQAANLKYILEKNKYEVQHASKAIEAIALLQHYHPNIIISDIIMPKMDGFELCSLIKSSDTLSKIPIILLTALSDSEDILKGLECGADSFITKPYSEDFLLSKLQLVIENSKLKQENKSEIEILFSGKKHRINSSKRQIINLLLSTYENSVIKNKELILTNKELKETQKRLERLNKDLDKKVNERTQRIENTNAILRAIRRISQLIIKEKDRKNLIDEACHIIIQSDVFQNVWISVSDNKKKIIESAVINANNKTEEMDENFLIKHNPVCYQKTLTTNGVVIMSKSNEHCMQCKNSQIIKNNDSGVLAMRLTTNGHHYGMINVVLPLDLIEDKEEQLLFKEIAEDIAFALHNIELEKERSSAELEANRRVKQLQCLHQLSELSERSNLSLSEYFHKIPNIIQKGFQDPKNTGCRITVGGMKYKTVNFIETNQMLRTFISHKNEKVGIIEVCYLKEPYIRVNNKSNEERNLLRTIVIHVGEYIEKKRAEEELKTYHENLEDLVKERATELSNERNLLRILIDSLPDQIYAKNTSHQFILANKNTLESLKKDNSEAIIGKTDFDIFSNDLAQKNHLEEQNIFQVKKDIIQYEERVNYPNNQSKWYNITKVPFKNEENEVIGLVGINRDITFNKKAEINMLKAKEMADLANQAKSMFLANMSHEIRTPMNAIIGYTEILNNKITDPGLKDYLTSIISSSKSLLELINEILDLSKIESGKMKLSYEYFNIQNLITKLEQMFQMKAKKKGLFYEIVSSRQLPEMISLDELRIRQVIINLIDNAIKFTKSGFVSVALQVKNKTESQFDLIIKVSDSGIGIPFDKKELIFGDFTQSDHNISKLYGGTGLGLSISKRIVKLLNGNIEVNSIINEGSTFVIEIPNVEYTNSQNYNTTNNEDINPNEIKFNKAKILVVDDVKTNREILKNHIESFHHEVYIAENGLKGILLAKEKKPDIIFMDIKMPLMDGFEATRELKKHEETKCIPIIACTASLINVSEKEFLSSGFSGLLSKPILLKDIMDKLCQYIEWKKVDNKVVKVENKKPVLDAKSSELLKQQALPIWELLKKRRSSKSQTELAEVLIKTGSALNNNYLKNLGEQLLNAIQVFNIEKINTIMLEIKTHIID